MRSLAVLQELHNQYVSVKADCVNQPKCFIVLLGLNILLLSLCLYSLSVQNSLY